MAEIVSGKKDWRIKTGTLDIQFKRVLGLKIRNKEAFIEIVSKKWERWFELENAEFKIWNHRC